MPHATHSRFSGAVLRAAGLNALIALAAAILSFHALFDLGRMTGVFPGWLPLLLPVVVDVFILQSSLSLVVAAAHARADRRYHWTILTISSTVSVVLNAYHALVVNVGELPELVSAGIAIIPPLALLASTHGLIVHLSRQSPATHAHDRGEALSSNGLSRAEELNDVERGRTSDEHTPLDGTDVTTDVDPDAHAMSQRVPTSEVEVSDEHMALARAVRSAARVTKTEHEVARVIALWDAGYNSREIAELHPWVAVRQTIDRWLRCAREIREREGLVRSDADLAMSPP